MQTSKFRHNRILTPPSSFSTSRFPFPARGRSLGGCPFPILPSKALAPAKFAIIRPIGHVYSRIHWQSWNQTCFKSVSWNEFLFGNYINGAWKSRQELKRRCFNSKTRLSRGYCLISGFIFHYSNKPLNLVNLVARVTSAVNRHPRAQSS
jgi:hypothetical protein